MQKYEFVSVCGEGFYGTVFRSRVKGTKRMVAIKQFKGSEDYATKREIAVLSRLKHPNIIHLVEVLRPKGKLHMVFEFLDNDLLNILSKEYQQGMPEKLVRPYMQQLCQGLEYCHKRNIIHRDIKPENCLILGDHKKISCGKLKLCDFGEARVVHPGDKKLSAIIGTRWYRAPEILSGSKTTTGTTGSNASDCGAVQKIVRPKLLEYTNVSDLWGVGCIMGELLIGSPMYPADTDLQQLAIVQKFSTAPQLQKRMGAKLSSGGMSLLTGLLTLAPAKRLTATTALAHPYYTGSDYDDSKPDKERVESKGTTPNAVAEEIDDDSFDGDFSDVAEEEDPATNDDEDFDDFDDESDDADDSFDDDSGAPKAAQAVRNVTKTAKRPDTPVLGIYKAAPAPAPKPEPKIEPKKPNSGTIATKETSRKNRRHKSKRRIKRTSNRNKGKDKAKDKQVKVSDKASGHSKKKHRHRTRADDQSRSKKKSSKRSSQKPKDASKSSRHRSKKNEVPSYARATTAASSKTHRSRSRNPKDKKERGKKRRHRGKPSNKHSRLDTKHI